MLLKQFTFDSRNVCWVDYEDCNIMFLLQCENYVNDIIRLRGYIYLNQICEILGVEWNPDDVNHCIKNNMANRIKFVELETFPETNNGILVNILTYD